MKDKPIVVKITSDDKPHPMCDFCGSCPMHRPVKAYPASRFGVQIVAPGYGEITHDFQDDGWAACARCWPSVEAQDIAGLSDAFDAEHPPWTKDREAAMIGAVLRMRAWQMFFEHRTGPGIDHDPDTGPPVFPPEQR